MGLKENINQPPPNSMLNVNPEHVFKLADTTIELRNLHELAEALEIMSDESYNHHVTDTKNDFAVWVKEVLHDDMLSQKLQSVSKKKAALKAVNQRIKQVEKTSGSQDKPSMASFWIGVFAGLVIGLIAAVVAFRLI